MDDKKLMHYAAIAYGAKKDHVFVEDCYYDPDCMDDRFWVPLGNDAHAFRIMSKLEIDVEWSANHVSAIHRSTGKSSLEKKYGDPKECFRRAIVKCAASLVEEQ